MLFELAEAAQVVVGPVPARMRARDPSGSWREGGSWPMVGHGDDTWALAVESVAIDHCRRSGPRPNRHAVRP